MSVSNSTHKNVFDNSIVPVLALTGAYSLSKNESGFAISLTQVAGVYTVALPAAMAGLYYKFILSTAAAGTVTILSAGAAGTMRGALISSDGAAAVSISTNGVKRANAVGVQIVGGTAIVGDSVDIMCLDGTNWVAHGQSGATNGNVFST